MPLRDLTKISSLSRPLDLSTHSLIDMTYSSVLLCKHVLYLLYLFPRLLPCRSCALLSCLACHRDPSMTKYQNLPLVIFCVCLQSIVNSHSTSSFFLFLSFPSFSSFYIFIRGWALASLLACPVGRASLCFALCLLLWPWMWLWLWTWLQRLWLCVRMF